MSLQIMPSKSTVPTVCLLPPALLLFVLPFAHTAALRSLTLAATLIAAAFFWRLNAASRTLRPPLLTAFALWIAAGLISLPMAINPLYSLGEFKGDVLYSTVLFSAFFVLGADTAVLLLFRRICLASLLTISLIAAVSFAQFGEWRVGLHNALGEYGTFVVTTLPLAITVFFPGQLRGGRGEQLFASITFAAVAYGAFLSRSRGLLMVIAVISVAVLLYAARHHRQQRRMLLTGAAVLFAGALIAAMVASHQRGTELAALHDRDRIYSVALDEIARHPLTGVGFGREANREAYKQAFPGMLLRHAHNLFLSYAEQMGIGGLIALFALFGSLFLQFGRLLRESDATASLLGVIGLTLCLAVLLKNMSDMFFSGHNLLLFWAHCGLLLGLGQRIAPRCPVIPPSAP